MSWQDEEIQKKLVELETSLKENQPVKDVVFLPTDNVSESPNLFVEEKSSVKAELFLLSGCGLILAGILMIFNHIRIGTSLLNWLGLEGRGIGLLLVLFLIGIGALCYNFKSPLGWVLTIAATAAILCMLLLQLTMIFPAVSMLSLIFMFLPLVVGSVFLMHGLNMQKTRKLPPRI